LRDLSDHIIDSLNETTADNIDKKWLDSVVWQFHHPGIKKNDFTLMEYLDKFIKEIETGERKYLKRTPGGNTWERYGRGTIKTYYTFRTQLSAYEKDRNRTLRFNDITLEFYKDFVSFFEEEKRDSTGKITKKSYKPNTIGKQVKMLKTVMAAAEKEDLHHNKFYNTTEFITYREEIEPVYLTEEEIKSLYNLDLAENKPLEIARDVFLVGCWTALRYGDYSRISQYHVTTTGKGVKVIRIKTQKTGEPVDIPIRPELDQILSKYDYTLPHTHEQKVNKHIKEVAKMAGINEPVRDVEIKNGQRIDKTVPKYKKIMTHTARRSGATNMYKAGIPSISIMKITGHKTEANFLKYICIDREENAEIMFNNQYFSGNLRIS
jgi:integrase